MNTPETQSDKPTASSPLVPVSLLDALEISLKAEQDELKEKGAMEAALAVQSVRAAIVTAQLAVLTVQNGSASGQRMSQATPQLDRPTAQAELTRTIGVGIGDLLGQKSTTENMDTVKNITLIETTLTRRGDGESYESPIRIITQYWTPDGQLVVERDPCATQLTPERKAKLRDFLAKELDPDHASKIYNQLDALLA